MKAVRLFVLLLAFVGALPMSAQAPIENLVDGCVETYDPSVDYFPVESEVTHAEGFEIEYFNHYKVITVTRPWQQAETLFTYVLVQCGAPVPEGYEDAAVIEVPTQRVITMSTTYLPHFVDLGLVDTIIATDEFDFVYSPEVRERIDAGELSEIGGGSTVNVELALDLEPDVIFTYGLGSPDYDAHPVLIDAGLNVALNSDYMETSPLGRAEWLKFTALFFNREAEANAIFDEIVTRYTELTELAATAEEQPKVLVNAMYGDTWYVSGGASYVAEFIADAGGAYAFADDESSGGVPLDFESVLEAAQDADVWLNPNYWFSLADGLAEDARYSEFAAFENGGVYNNVARVNATGGNDFLETGAAHPELVLADLIAIFHPELLPDHTLTFYMPLS